MGASRAAAALALCCLWARSCLSAPPAVRVGLLSGHDPRAWRNATCGAEGTRPYVLCNLRVYEAAIETAAAQGVQLLLFPEGPPTTLPILSLVASRPIR